jgi:HD-GYP domain-containing protein (c-di-GMP phosphodiesterase class II)
MSSITIEPRPAVSSGTTPAIYDEPATLPPVARGTLVRVLSRLIDLAESREPGHAERVAYVAAALCDALAMGFNNTQDTWYAALLHDIAKVIWPSDIGLPGATDGDGRLLTAGQQKVLARTLRGMGMRSAVGQAVAGHYHFSWLATRADGKGPGPQPLSAHIVAAAERLDSMASAGRSALLVRRSGRGMMVSLADDGIDVRVVEALGDLSADDSFWIRYYNNDSGPLPVEGLGEAKIAGQELLSTLGVVADLIDVRNGHPPGRARRVAELAMDLAARRGETPERARLIQAAALLQDVGTLGVPASCVRKPDLLTVDELADVQAHPVLARDILSEIPGLGALAWWIGCHHERIDGRGYPAGLEGPEVPIEAQMIGLCEAYDALTKERPHRPALAAADALEIVRGLASSRFEADLVAGFERLLADRPAAG